MILFSHAKPHREVWCGVTSPEFQFVNVATGEVSNSPETLEHPGALFVFADLPEALETLALKLSQRGTLEIYGDSLSAAWWRIGREGVRLTGLQGYGASKWDLQRVVDFWKFLTDVCAGVGTAPGATPGTTALRIVANTSPRRISNHGAGVQDFSNSAFSAGARHSRPGHYRNAFLYDVHSAFPKAMLAPLPFGDAMRTKRETDFYIDRVTFDYQSNFDFSPLWVRASDGKIYHPTTAKHVTATLNAIDLQTLERHGKLSISKLHKRIAFDCEPLLEPAQTYLSNWQKQVPQFRQQIKILRNSIYGKLAQQPTQKRYVLKPIADIHASIATKKLWRDYNAGQFGLFRHESTGRPFTHFPVAGAITAAVRSQIYDAIDANSIAVRTDAILSKKQRDDLETGPLDGQWALNETGEAVVFGQSGFVIGDDHAHLDGVQEFSRGQARSARREKFAFGEDKTISAWIPAIESRMHMTANGEILNIKRGRTSEKLKIEHTR